MTSVTFVTAKGVPPVGASSVPMVLHEITRRCSDRLEIHVVSGTLARQPRDESPGIVYSQMPDRVDRRIWDPTFDWFERCRHVRADPYLRGSYHLPFGAHTSMAARTRHSDVVVSMHFPQWLGLVRKAAPRAKRVVWAHSADPVAPGTRLVKELRRADGVLACSRYVADRFVDAVPELEGRTFVVYNGIDPMRFSRDVPTRTTGVEPLTLLYVGVVSPQKGVHVLVDAFHALAESRPNLRLVLVGRFGSVPTLLASAPGPRIAEIAAMPSDFASELVRRAGAAADRMSFTGPLFGDDLVRAFTTASVCVLPSLYHEGFGLPVVEAMASGVPVVVSRSGGMPELVDEGETGAVVPPGDVEALAAAIATLIDDPQLLLARGEQAATVARERFTWESSASALVSAITGFAE